jgi:hypothetical protein
MRVAVFVVLALMVSTPSEASKSCMSKAEARQHFGSVHIYWHGAGHCWDATSGRGRHRAHKVQQVRQVQRKMDKMDLPKWYESMSQMLPDEEPVATPWADRWVEILPPRRPMADITGSTPPAVIESSPEPMLTPRAVLMAILAIALTLVLVELVFSGRRWAGRGYQRN